MAPYWKMKQNHERMQVAEAQAKTEQEPQFTAADLAFLAKAKISA